MPVFMKVWAGSWLMASVFIERMMHSSSAIEPMCGNSSQISCPLVPNFLKANCGAKQFSLAPWSWAMGWPLVNDSGMGWPWSWASLGL